MSIDPARSDTTEAKRRLAGQVALWGAVNGHLTVEAGSEADVRQEVPRAVEVLAPAGGAILSPVDSVREDTPISRHNVQALIDEWRRAVARRPGSYVCALDGPRTSGKSKNRGRPNSPMNTALAAYRRCDVNARWNLLPEVDTTRQRSIRILPTRLSLSVSP